MIRPGLFLFFLVGIALTAAAQDTYLKLVASHHFNSQAKIKSTPDGGWAVYTPDSSCVYKFNPCGVLQWARKYNLPPTPYKGLDYFITTRKGGFAFFTRVESGNEYHTRLVVLDGQGHLVWCRDYRSPNFAHTSYSIDQDKAGNFLLYANVSKVGGGETYNLVAKIKENGVVNWVRYYNHGGIWGGALMTSDNGVLARTGRNLIKTDSMGQVEWSCFISSGSDSYYTPVEVANGYLVNGKSLASQKTAYFKISKTGQSMWSGIKAVKSMGKAPFLRRKANGNLVGVCNRSGYPTVLEFDTGMNVVKTGSIKLGGPFEYYNGLDVCFIDDSNPVILGSAHLGDFVAYSYIFTAKTMASFGLVCDTTLPDTTIEESGTVLPLATSSSLQAMETQNVSLTYENLNPEELLQCASLSPLQMHIEGDSLLCVGQQGQLRKAGNSVFDQYEWSTGETGTSITVTQPGTYFLNATNTCRAESRTDTFEVKQPILPHLSWFADTSLCNSDTITLHALVEGAQYKWQDSSRKSFFKAHLPGTYRVEVNLDGCTRSFTTTVADCERLEMPNLFTPNEDGMNDRFVARIYKGITQAELQIYNRWGKKVHTTTDIRSEGWSGNSHTNGVYFWLLRYTNFAGQQKQLKGTVVLYKG